MKDSDGYLDAMGQAQTAQAPFFPLPHLRKLNKWASRFALKVKKDAVVGEAEAKRDSTIAEAKANEQKMQVDKSKK